ncbi:MAG: hypothetical protein OEZ04_07985, partial [Nitrospinota bacterium]|nr:hypothetical protein [Nitrospinota bacterium]
LLDMGLQAKVLTLPGAKDADEFLARNGVEELEKFLAKAPSFAQFVIDSAAQAADLSTVEGRAQAAREALPYINRIRDRIERNQYTQILAEKTGVEFGLINSEAAAMARSAPGRAPAMSVPAKKHSPRQGARAAAERIVIRILLDCPDYLDEHAGGLGPANFEDEENRGLFEFITSAAHGGAKDFPAILEAAREAGMQASVTDRSIETNLYDENGAAKAMEDCVRTLLYRPEDRKRSLLALLERAGGDDKKKFEDAQKEYIKSRNNGLI